MSDFTKGQRVRNRMSGVRGVVLGMQEIRGGVVRVEVQPDPRVPFGIPYVVHRRKTYWEPSNVEAVNE